MKTIFLWQLMITKKKNELIEKALDVNELRKLEN